MKKPVITVVGSINMDLFITTDRRPAPGETVLGNAFYTSPGGKGANQAVAAARLGAEVNMIGRVGDDQFGEELKSFLAQENIFLDSVEPVTHGASGVAAITLSEGDNSIIVYQGANLETTPAYVQKYEALIAKSDVVLTQLEIPMETVKETVALCEKHGTKLVLNPAPIAALSNETLEKVDFITPNELEYATLAAERDMTKYLEKLIVTKGKEGIRYYANGREQNIPSHTVNVADTTGAGDTFNGAFAYAIASGQVVHQACEFANAAAALAIQKRGAQAGMPTQQEVNEFLQGNG